jgi:glycosyltransferase involved in cell wall biosynthesis
MHPPRRVAIVHEWLSSMRGGEKVVEAFCGMFPGADIHTLFHVPGSVSGAIEAHPIHTSFLQKFPFAKSHYRYYLPLFPSAIERLLPDEYDLVISSHHSVAKGVRTGKRTLHLCYCHTPMRYIWDLFDEYFGPERSGIITRTGARLFRGYLQRWDRQTADRPHLYIANSQNIRRRIRETYERDAVVIYPPVDTASFEVSRTDRGYFLVAGALVPYKRVDVAVQAFNASGDRLVIAGDGPERARLERASKRNIEFRGYVTDAELRHLFAGCRSLVFPGEEDFGIIPVEAMASGKPVIAFGRGGALETVVDGVTGVLFSEQTPAGMRAALGTFGQTGFDPQLIRSHAERFDRKVFLEGMTELIETQWEEFSRKPR